MDEATGTPRRIGDALAALAAVPLAGASDDGLCEWTIELERAGRLLDGLRARAAGEIDERSRFAAGAAGLSDRYGFRKGAQLLEFLTRISPAEARRRVRIGAATRAGRTLGGDPLPARHPLVSRALDGGEMGVDAASIIIRCLGQASPAATAEEIGVAEAALVIAAERDSADLVAVQARA